MLSRNFKLSFLLVICIINVVYVFCDEDYYKILGVPRSADEAAIKKAFKKLSIKYHPDKNQDNPEAEKLFQAVANAYEVLIDPEQRELYNQFGEQGLKEKLAQKGSYQNMYQNFWNQGHQFVNPYEDYWSGSDAIQLSMKEISKFYRRDQLWILYFYKSNQPESRSHKDLIRDLGNRLNGVVKVAGVNCLPDFDEVLCEEFVMFSTPKILIVPASLKAEPVVYEGPMNFNAVANYAINMMENFVTLLNDENYEAFIKSQSKSTKYLVLTFTQKKTTSGLLKALSKEYKEKLEFGEIRVDEKNHKIAEQYNIKNYPAIVLVTDGFAREGVIYQGAMEKDDIKNFLREYAYNQNNKKRAPQSTGVLEGLTPKVLNSGHCNQNDGKMCLLLILDGDTNNKAKNEQEIKHIFKELAFQYKDDAINFYYLYESNIKYANSFEENDSPFPKLLILKSKRNKYVEFNGPVTPENSKCIEDFVEYIVSGSGDYLKMKGDLVITHYKYTDEM